MSDLVSTGPGASGLSVGEPGLVVKNRVLIEYNGDVS